MHSRFLGGILLIVGTSIGAGMLALPVANAAAGFWVSTLGLLFCWSLMTLGALFILEVNLYLPRGKNMVSMAHATLGKPGLLVAWITYLFLLYSLLSAYISGGADVLNGLLQRINIDAKPWQLTTLFTLSFGLVVYGGIRQVDLMNRGLMFSKLAIYAVLVVFIAPYMDVSYFQRSSAKELTGSLMILMTSFGFAIIVPNLRDYFNDDVKALRKVILLGSLIPLVCYIAWDAVIIGTLPAKGSDGLIALMQSDHTTSSLALLLTGVVNNSVISMLFNCFTSICMLTAFLGVSLCLFSFLSDGLNFYQHGKQGGALFVLTFIPPLVLVLFYPGAYIYALRYAGYFCVILLLLLPALMSYFGRATFNAPYLVPGGKLSQGLVITSALLLMVVSS